VAPPADEQTIELVARERRRRPRLRTFLLNDRAQVEERVDALRRGFDEALPTDTEPREVAARLLLLDAQAGIRADTQIRVATGVVLDTVAHELRRGGTVVHIRPKEYQLLSMLASHPGRAYSRRQLIDRVWGHDHDGDPRTVDVHVRWLRSKIEPDPGTPVHLVTVRGVGYRLDPDGP
jgi:DNA-binding response OmpR family regulator